MVKTKTYCKGYSVTRQHVLDAYHDWCAGESGRKNWWRVEEEYDSADDLVDEIWEQVNGRLLEFRPIHRYTHVEPTNGKTRIIGVESIKQQVCDYLAVNALMPLIKAKLGYYQCAGVKGKGQSLCRSALRRWSREGGYFVKADVRQCYPSTRPDVVMRMLRRYVKSEVVLYLCETLMATYDQGGMEIGSYFSLCMLNLVLSFAYHHLEGLSKIRRGKAKRLISHQIWHMDDVLIFGRDKRDLRRAMRSMERYLMKEFGLTFKPWKICRVSRSERPDMGGWVAYEGKITLRRGIFLRGMRAFRRFRARPSLGRARRVASYWGWWVNGGLLTQIRDRQLTRISRMAATMVRKYDRLEIYGTEPVGHAA